MRLLLHLLPCVCVLGHSSWRSLLFGSVPAIHSIPMPCDSLIKEGCPKGLMGGAIETGQKPPPLYLEIRNLIGKYDHGVETPDFMVELKELLANQTDLNAEIRDEENRTTLMWSVFDAVSPVVNALINAGMDVNATDKDGYTALHHAVYYLSPPDMGGGHTSADLVESLIKANVNVDAASFYNPFAQESEYTALLLAIYLTQFESSADAAKAAVELLIGAGADIDKQMVLDAGPDLTVRALGKNVWQWTMKYEEEKPDIYAAVGEAACDWILEHSDRSMFENDEAYPGCKEEKPPVEEGGTESKNVKQNRKLDSYTR